MAERDKRFHPALAADQVIFQPRRFVLRPQADGNRHLQAQRLDAVDDHLEFLLVAVARIQNVNLRNGNHYYFIIHIVSSRFTRSAMPKK